MIKFFKMVTLLCWTLTCSFALAATKNDALVDKIMHAWMSANNIPGAAVTLYTNGEPHTYYYGYADKSAQTPVTDETIFEIGGVSNIMTSLLVAEEIDLANMSLKDPVKNYVKDLPESFSDVTLLDIATHTAGLPSTLPADIKTQADLNRYLAKWQGGVLAGDKWAPSHIGAGVLGKALEGSTTKDYDWLFFHHVTALLGMKHLGVNVQDRFQTAMAKGYRKDGAPTDSLTGGLLPAANEVKLSAGDMQKFLAAAIGLPGTPDRVLYPMRMTQSGYIKLQDRVQGLGWEIHPLDAGLTVVINKPVIPSKGSLAVNQVVEQPLFNGDALIDKAGTTNGFGSYIAVLPNKKAGIAIMANKGVSDDAIARTGREILLKAVG